MFTKGLLLTLYRWEGYSLPLAVRWWDLVTGKVHKASVSKRCFTLLPLVIWMKIKNFLKSLEKGPFSLPIKWGENFKTVRLVNLEKWIALRIFYVPSAVGRPASYVSTTQTPGRTFGDGDDRQRTQWYLCSWKAVPRWDPRGGEIPMRPNARSEDAYPLFGASRTNTNSDEC